MAVMAPEQKRALKTTPHPTAPGAADLSAAVEVIAAFVRSFEPGRYAGADAATLVSVFTAGKRLCAAGETLAATRAAQCHPERQSGHRTPGEWLSSVTGVSRGEATDLLTLGEALADQPEVDEALRRGELTTSRATLISGAARVNPATEADLVQGGTTDTLGQLRERCLRARAEGRSPEDEGRHRQALHRSRRCRTSTDPEGACCLEARLAPEAGARLLAALGTETDRCFELARREGRTEPAEAYRADALVALVTGAGRPGDPPRGRQGGGRDQVTVRVDLDALRRGQVGAGERCEIPGVGPVPVPWARGLLGEALVDLVIANATDVTTLYRMGRHLPAPLRAALLERDPRCVVPGCDRRFGLEHDHWVTDFARGGLTAMDNLARLCEHHHRLRTHRGFQLLRQDGQWRWVPPEHPVVPKRSQRRRTTKAEALPAPPTEPHLFTDTE
jgi:hypothetical protein